MQPATSLLRHPSPPVSAVNFIRREVQRLVGFVYPNVSVFGAPVDRRLNDDSATAGIRTINCVGFDESPLARWAPVLIKLTITVFRILVRVLLPARVLVPYPKRRFKVLPLEGREKFVCHPPLRIIPQMKAY